MFNDKVALVTGGASGLGEAISRKLASCGCNVIINYHLSEEKAIKLKDELSKYNVSLMLIKCDVSNEEEVKDMIHKIIKKFGKIDIVVNNAGISDDSIIDDKTSETFMNVLKVNLIGPFLVSKYAGKYMLKNHYGKIINISSTNGIDTGYPEGMDYDASKAGLLSLTHNFAKLYAPYVNVNAICPGWIKTDMGYALGKELMEREMSKVLLGRFAEREEVANVVSFLASDEASYINDTIIRVDGGNK